MPKSKAFGRVNGMILIFGAASTERRVFTTEEDCLSKQAQLVKCALTILANLEILGHEDGQLLFMPGFSVAIACAVSVYVLHNVILFASDG